MKSGKSYFKLAVLAGMICSVSYAQLGSQHTYILDPATFKNYPNIGEYAVDGNSIFGIGTSFDPNSKLMGIISKIDTAGALTFLKAYRETGNDFSFGMNKIRVAGSNNYLVSGQSVGALGCGWLGLIDGTGTVVKAQKYPTSIATFVGTGGWGNLCNVLPAGAGGSYAFAGQSAQTSPAKCGGGYTVGIGPSQQDVLLIKTDANLDTTMVRRFSLNYPFTCTFPADSVGNEFVNDFITTSTGFVFCGSRADENAPSKVEGFAFATDFSGNVQWAKTFSSPSGNHNNYAQAIIQVGSDYIMTGWDYTLNAAYAIRFNSGSIVWSKIYTNGSVLSGVNRIIKDVNDGNFIISGQSPLNSNDLLMFKIDANGTIINSFTKQIGRAGWSEGAFGISTKGSTALQSTNGTYFLLGPMDQGGVSDGFLMARLHKSYVTSGCNETAGTIVESNFTFRVRNPTVRVYSLAVVPQSMTLTPTDYTNGTSATKICVFSPLAVTANVLTNKKCNGGTNDGSATATVSTGMPNYTYSWSNGVSTSNTSSTTNTITGLSNGTYTVTITDAGATTRTATITITQPATAVTATTSVTVAKCGIINGTATANPTGGSGTYLYSWNTGSVNQTISNLAANTYTVTVTDAIGCTTTQTAQVTATPAVTATESSTRATCGQTNGIVAAHPVTGGGSYSYAWTNSGGAVGTGQTVTGLAPGTYSVTITDGNNCTTTGTTAITSAVAAVISTPSTADVKCFGFSTGSASATASGGTSPLSYSWSPAGGTALSISNVPAGNYTLTVTDSLGCKSSSSVTITQPATAVSASTAATVAKCGVINGTATATPAGGNSPYTFSWNTNGTSQIITSLSAAVYTVTVTDAFGCITTQTAQVSATPAVTASASATLATCGQINGSVTVNPLTGSGTYTYSWSNNLGSVGTTQTVTGLGADTYTVIITDGNNCTTSGSALVNSAGSATINTPTTVDVTCNGLSNGSATTTTSGGTTPLTYSWSPSGGTALTISNVPAGNYTLAVTDNHGCKSFASVVISQPLPLKSAVTQPAIVLCKGGSDASASVTASDGNSGYSYSWNTAPAQTTSTATGLIAGTYTATVNDSKGCISTKSITITEPNQLVTAAAQSTSVSCKGLKDGTASATVTGGTTNYSYSWNISPVQTVANATGLGAGTYTVNVTDANGCKSSATTTITEPTLLNLDNLQQTNVFCFGGSNGAATETPFGGTSPYSYSWSSNPVQTSSVATGLSAGTYTMTVTDKNNCTSTSPVVITQPLAALTSTASQATGVSCNSGKNGTATANPVGGTSAYSYSWSTTPSQTSITASGLPAGTYTVKVTDIKGCTTSATATITEPTSISLSGSTQTDALCFGDNNGTAHAAPVGGTSPFTYTWSTNPVQSTVNATGLTAGTYSLVVTDNNNCTSVKVVTISQPVQLSAATSVTQSITCNGTTGNATGSGTGGTAPYTFTWNTSPGQTTAIATGLSAGTYTVTVKDLNGCMTTSNVSLTQPQALATTAAVGSTICEGTSTVISGSASNGSGPYTYSWTVGTGTSSSYAVHPTTTTTYTMTVKDACGATSTATVIVNVNKKPHAQFSVKPVTANSGQEITYTDSSANAVSWSWDFGDENSSNDRNPVHSYTASGSYPVTLIVTSVKGCKDTAIFNDVIIRKNIIIPNIFTPTGDGVNDNFVVTTSGVVEYLIEIYDRWGLKMFTSDNINMHWDGHAPSGSPAPEGTYYYIVTGKFGKGEGFQRQGYLQLMR